MAEKIDDRELQRHQATFHAFMHATTWAIGLIIVLLVLMAIFLV